MKKQPTARRLMKAALTLANAHPDSARQMLKDPAACVIACAAIARAAYTARTNPGMYANAKGVA